MDLSWKDELMLRELETVTPRGALSPAEAFTRALQPGHTDAAAFIRVERYLAEREERQRAEQRVQDHLGAAETWCGRARRWRRQRNALLYAAVMLASYGAAVTWLLVRLW